MSRFVILVLVNQTVLRAPRFSASAAHVLSKRRLSFASVLPKKSVISPLKSASMRLSLAVTFMVKKRLSFARGTRIIIRAPRFMVQRSVMQFLLRKPVLRAPKRRIIFRVFFRSVQSKVRVCRRSPFSAPLSAKTWSKCSSILITPRVGRLKFSIPPCR